jgi:hypothetical protein
MCKTLKNLIVFMQYWRLGGSLKADDEKIVIRHDRTRNILGWSLIYFVVLPMAIAIPLMILNPNQSLAEIFSRDQGFLWKTSIVAAVAVLIAIIILLTKGKIVLDKTNSRIILKDGTSIPFGNISGVVFGKIIKQESIYSHQRTWPKFPAEYWRIELLNSDLGTPVEDMIKALKNNQKYGVYLMEQEGKVLSEKEKAERLKILERDIEILKETYGNNKIIEVCDDRSRKWVMNLSRIISKAIKSPIINNEQCPPTTIMLTEIDTFFK